MIWRVANDDLCGRETVRQCFNRLHNCGIASIMHDWADAMSDEIKDTLRRGLAIQFCEIGNHSTADRGLREVLARSLRHVLIAWSPWALLRGLEGF